MKSPRKSKLEEIGEEPDARFSFANERTFLAWNRTALALVVAGLAIVQFLPKFNIPGGRRIIGLPLIVLGAIIAFTSFSHWRANEIALRLRRPLPSSRLPQLLAGGVGLGALIAAVIAAVSRS